MGGEGYRNSKPQESVGYRNSQPAESVPPDSVSNGILELQRKYALARAARSGSHRVEESAENSEEVDLNAVPIPLNKIKKVTFVTMSESTYELVRQDDSSYFLVKVNGSVLSEKGNNKIRISERRSKKLTIKLGEPFEYDPKGYTTPIISGKVTLL